MTMGKRCSAVFPVIRQYAPSVARAHSHQCSRLVQSYMLCQQAVHNLESRLFFGLQSHILHMLNVTLYAGQLARTLSLDVNILAVESCQPAPGVTPERGGLRTSCWSVPERSMWMSRLGWVVHKRAFVTLGHNSLPSACSSVGHKGIAQ